MTRIALFAASAPIARLLSHALLVLALAACSSLGLQPASVDPTLRSQAERDVDEAIVSELNDIFSNSDEFLPTRVRVLSFRRTVVLYGEAPNATLQERVAAVAQLRRPDIAKLYNQVRVSEQYNEPDIAADREVAALVRSRLLFTKTIDMQRFIFRVDRRNVYALGAVSSAMQADIANTIAQVNGVLQVNIFFDLLD